jgi:subtilase family serine protease
MASRPRTILAAASGSLLALAGAWVVTVQPAAAAAPRLERVGTVPRLPVHARVLSAPPSRTKLHITVALAPRDPAALAAYARSVSTPGSVAYRRFLTPRQFASRFGATPAAIAAVEQSLSAAGLHGQPASANGLAIRATAPAAAVSDAFHTSFTRVRVAGRTAIVNDSAPLLDRQVARLVQSVIGLDGLAAPRPLFVRPGALSAANVPHATPHVVTGGPQPCPEATTAASANSSYTIDQIASAYDFSSLYKAGDEGQGQTIALYELEPNDPSDIAAYQACFGTSASVRYIPVDGGAGSGTGSGEAALDIETAIGLAPKASFLVYQAPNSNSSGPGAGPYDLFSEIISEDKAQVISASWGQCEALEGSADANAEQALFEEAAVQGQTFVSASGDQGSEDCFGGQAGGGSELAVDDPASQPYVTSVGGTKLSSLGPRPAESTWNDGCVAGLLCGTGASGGGISSLWPMPPYQLDAAPFLQLLANPCARPSGHCREVPDVAADGDPATGYTIYWNGSGTTSGPTKWQSIGGTSAGAPTWAALIALANASSECRGVPLGFANPVLYGAASGAYASDFNDVTSGDNDYTGTNPGKFTAGAGYDPTTGLGTPNAAPLVQSICSISLRITDPGAQSSTVHTAAKLQLAVSDPGGSGLTYKATDLPAGLRINSSTGAISGKPSKIQTKQVSVTVSDSQARVGRVSFGWTVGAPPRVSHATLAGLARGRPQLAFTLTAGRNGPALTAVKIAAPHGLRFASSSHGLTVSAAGKRVRHTAKLQTGSLTIALKAPQTAIRIKVAAPSVRATGATVRLKLKVTPTDAGGHRTPLEARLRS